VRLASRYEEIHGLGAEVVAVSVNEETRQAGMATRWGLTHTRFVSDPGGESYLQPLQLFDPEERGGIALPGMVIITPGGDEVYRYQGRDYADRTNDDDLFEALSGLGLPEVAPAPWTPTPEVPEDLRGYFRSQDFLPYFKGNFYGAAAITGRLDTSEARAIAREHRAMSKANLDVWETWRKRVL